MCDDSSAVISLPPSQSPPPSRLLHTHSSMVYFCALPRGPEVRCNHARGVCVCARRIIPAAFIISLYSSGLGGERSCYMLYPPFPPPPPPSLCEYSSCHFLSYLTVYALQAPRSRFILKQEPFQEQRSPLWLAGVGWSVCLVSSKHFRQFLKV